MKHNLVQRVSALGSAQRAIVIASLVVVIGVVGSLSLHLTTPGSNIAVWWPATGLGIAAALFAGKRKLVVALAIAIVTSIVAHAGGKPVDFAIAGGVINGIEVWSIASVLSLGRGPIIATVRDAGRFLIVAFGGGILFGLMAATVVWLMVGGDFLATFVAAAPSHLSADILLVPIVLVTWTVRRNQLGELAIQTLILFAVICVVFWPGQGLPLAFLPFPFLIWGAKRFGLGVASVQIAAIGILTFVFTVSGGGPFALVAQGTQTATALQIFFVTYGGSTLVLGAMSAEREVLVRRIAASERQLRGALASAQIGLLVVERTALGVRVVETNPALVDLLDLDESHLDDLPRDLVDKLLEIWPTDNGSWSGEWDTADTRRLGVFASTSPGLLDVPLLTVQFVDITVRVAAENALAKALAAEQAAAITLRELNERQDRLVATVSHELRTPIASITGFAEELAESDLSEEQSTYLAVIQRNATRLLHLVNNLLKLAELDSGSAVQESTPTPLPDVISATIQDLEVTARAKGVNMGAKSWVLGRLTTTHPFELSQILVNLCSNAIKFTPEGGSVTIDTSIEQRTVVLRVSDTGTGIPPEELQSVLERFTRSSRSGSVAGTGLGLAIVVKLVEALGGDLHLESDGSTGTTAVVRLPIATEYGIEFDETSVAVS
jgi:two-component system, OmpR family, phosphate regulon sensor histidine kinase PhoR